MRGCQGACLAASAKNHSNVDDFERSESRDGGRRTPARRRERQWNARLLPARRVEQFADDCLDRVPHAVVHVAVAAAVIAAMLVAIIKIVT